MLKKSILPLTLSLFIFLGTTQAQTRNSGTNGSGSNYQNAIGLAVDFGSTLQTGAGIGFKHFFSEQDAGEVNLLFYNNTTSLAAYYEYHGLIQNAAGLKWYIGLGPQIFFGNNSTAFGGRFLGGLDYKIPNVPINFSFDWRPLISFTGGTEFYGARFGLGVRFAF